MSPDPGCTVVPCERPVRLITKRFRAWQKSNLAVRLLTVAVVAPALIGTLFLGPPTAWYGIIFAASLVGASELFGMTHPNDGVARAIGVVMTGAVSRPFISVAATRGSSSP